MYVTVIVKACIILRNICDKDYIKYKNILFFVNLNSMTS